MKNKQISKKREKTIGEQIHGRAHLRSGGMWFRKGDASNEHFLVEDKFTHAEKYSVKLSQLEKIEKEALQVNKIPIFRFGFIKENRDFVLIRTIYCPEDFYPPMIFTTNKKSITLYCNTLVSLYIGRNLKEVVTIRFTEYDKSYIMMTWNDFLNNSNKLIVRN
ncbi:MAG TPA: hypothetical protein P5136_00510 [Methanofastidiosum sp.]|nr:hypothetical protein [Methanofastidiosum sp.]